jgi:DNA-binding MarR family transcriptional regulator
MTTPLQETDYKTLATFRYELRKFLRFSKDLLTTTANLTPEQYEALLALKAFSTRHGLLVGELSERLQVKHHTAVSLVDKLVERKLVSRKRGTTDRRQVYVKLTASGAILVGRLADLHREELRARSAAVIAALHAIQQ